MRKPTKSEAVVTAGMIGLGSLAIGISEAKHQEIKKICTGEKKPEDAILPRTAERAAAYGCTGKPKTPQNG
jgi:hypothetical protein